MYQEPRPTCVTVIGWAWIVIGSLMAFSGVMGLVASSVMPAPKTSEPLPVMLRIFPILAAAQVCVAVLGLISGYQFLKLKAWSRNVLEWLTWLLLVLIVAFAVYWVIEWLGMASQQPDISFGVMGAVMGIVISAIYGVPLAIMLKYLRGSKVKNALAGPA